MNNEPIPPRRRNTSLSFTMSPLYSAAIEMATSLQTWYDASLYATAKAAIAEKEQKEIHTRNQMPALN